MKRKWISLDCHIAFEMKPGETNEGAEDRLLDVLDNANMNLVSLKNEEIEEFDDATNEWNVISEQSTVDSEQGEGNG